MNKIDRLLPLVESLRKHKMTANEVAEQRVSFAYGNATHDNRSTKEEVREAVSSVTAPVLVP